MHRGKMHPNPYNVYRVSAIQNYMWRRDGLKRKHETIEANRTKTKQRLNRGRPNAETKYGTWGGKDLLKGTACEEEHNMLERPYVEGL